MPLGLQRLLNTFFNTPLMFGTLPNILLIGLRNTLTLAVLAVAIGLILGAFVAVGLLSSRAWIRGPARAYVDVFRGLPAIVTVYLIGQGFPIAGLDIFAGNTYGYAALAIGLIEGAYMSEIFRAGIQSVDRGQSEGARSLGLTSSQTMRYVVFPQGARRVLPALTGQFILVVKNTSLVYLLGLTATQREMFAVAQDSAVLNASLSPLVMVGIIYLLITMPLTHVVNAWDRRLREGPRIVALPQRVVAEVA